MAPWLRLGGLLEGEMTMAICCYCDTDAWYTCVSCGETICHDHSVHEDDGVWCTECEAASIGNRFIAEAVSDSEQEGDSDG